MLQELVNKRHVCLVIRNKIVLIYKKSIDFLATRNFFDLDFYHPEIIKREIPVVTFDFSPLCCWSNRRRQFCEFHWPSSKYTVMRNHFSHFPSNERHILHFWSFLSKSRWLSENEIRNQRLKKKWSKNGIRKGKKKGLLIFVQNLTLDILE